MVILTCYISAVILPRMRQFFLVIAFVFTAAALHAQPTRYKNLVMEGAGVKGFAYAGALQLLDSLHSLQDIERVGGTSAGAIQACQLAVGYTPQEIMHVAATVRLRQFNDGAWFFGTGIRRLRYEFGYFKGEKIHKWIEQLIAEKTGNGNITFAELHEQRAVKNYKDLYVTGTDLTCQKLLVFSYESFPAMRIKDAVRISLSIPLYYKPVLIDDAGNVYETQDETKKLHIMIDGGVLSNYPLSIFDSTKYITGGANGINKPAINPETLGLLMEIPEQIKYNEQQPGNYPLAISSLRDYFKALYHTLIDKANPDGNGNYNMNRTIAIDNLNLFGRVRKLPQRTVNGLMESGREAVRRFFKVNGETPIVNKR